MWRVAGPKGAFARGRTLREAWCAAGARATEATQVGLGNAWAAVAGATCPEVWAVACAKQLDIVITERGVEEADAAEADGLPGRPPTAGDLLDTPTKDSKETP